MGGKIAFGDFLRRLCQEAASPSPRKYSLRDLEKMAQISHTYLLQVERGERGDLYFKGLERLAEICQVPVAEIEQAANQSKLDARNAQDAGEEACVACGYKQLSETKRQELKNFLQSLLQEQQRKEPR